MCLRANVRPKYLPKRHLCVCIFNMSADRLDRDHVNQAKHTLRLTFCGAKTVRSCATVQPKNSPNLHFYLLFQKLDRSFGSRPWRFISFHANSRTFKSCLVMVGGAKSFNDISRHSIPFHVFPWCFTSFSQKKVFFCNSSLRSSTLPEMYRCRSSATKRQEAWFFNQKFL